MTGSIFYAILQMSIHLNTVYRKDGVLPMRTKIRRATIASLLLVTSILLSLFTAGCSPADAPTPASTETPSTENSEPLSAELSILKDRYPAYFEMNTEHGLIVYIWEMAQGSYSCILVAGDKALSSGMLMTTDVPSIQLADMQAIVSYYLSRLSRDEIRITPTWHVLSSYIYNIDEAYIQRIEKLFWEGVTE